MTRPMLSVTHAVNQMLQAPGYPGSVSKTLGSSEEPYHQCSTEVVYGSQNAALRAAEFMC